MAQLLIPGYGYVDDGFIGHQILPGFGYMEGSGASADAGTVTTLTPAPGTVNATGQAPTITQTSTAVFSPAAGAAAAQGYAVQIEQTSTIVFSPAAGSAQAQGYAPLIEQLGSDTFTPAAGSALAQGYAPTIEQTITTVFSPAAGRADVLGYAPTIERTGAALSTRYARPDGVISAGSWAPSSGTDLAAMLSEPSADSSTYIEATGPAICEIALGPVEDPGTSSGQVVRYKVGSTTGNGLIVKLKQGDVDIAEWRHAVLPTAQTVFAQALTAPQCDSITDYANLRFSFEAF